MPYVIAEPCVSNCNSECVEVCPVDAIHGPPPDKPRLQLFIDPEACICCAACVSACPENAIFDEDDLPAEWSHYAAINRAFFENQDPRKAPAP
jgi:ferredoxin